ncbi:ribosome maturation factor RimM [Actinokineospora sp. NBRC 105648]|uniref:ribosome maturation factor RimM n=1 Tax=Actinokineospora sp. NBRC 105648 TaxID=3032206 RepID=UPI0024A5F4B8|nr:ribosome maturation factor RimM [Actinokineospora sp. NBRC 105648]GLZ41489.1 ribosome maturation factor RimM [Actinokineospora sp. NBRC 105648]
MEAANLVVVGRIAKAHGITGELAVDVRTDSPERRFALGATVLARLRDKTERTLTVAAAREHSGRLLLRFGEVPDRTAAEGLRGALLLGDTADLPPIDDPDEFYDHELEGLAAELGDGTRVGTVREVSHGAAGEMLVIDRADGGELLVPFVQALVPVVDVPGGRVVLDPPEGLIE